MSVMLQDVAIRAITIQSDICAYPYITFMQHKVGEICFFKQRGKLRYWTLNQFAPLHL